MSRETKAQTEQRIRAELTETLREEIMEGLRAEYAATIKQTRTRTPKPAGDVTRYSRPSIWHAPENQPSLDLEVSRLLADELTADRQLYARYHRVFKANGKDADEAKAAKAIFDTHHADYIAKCKVLNVLPGGY